MSSRFLLIELLLLVSLCSLSCARLSVTEREKALFVQATDLKRYGYEVDEIQKYETFSKRGSFDGTIELEYEFDDPAEQTFYLDVIVTISRTESDVRTEQSAKKTAMLDSLKADGIVIEENNDFYKYGDSSSFFILKKDETATGYYFIMRQGNKLYSLAVGGVNFEDPKDWKELVEPKLKLLSAYNPKENR